MAEVAKETYYVDKDGKLTTSAEDGLFLAAVKGAEITPDMASRYPDLKGGKAGENVGDSTLTDGERAAVEAGNAAFYARNAESLGQGSGDYREKAAEMHKAAQDAAFKDQAALAARIGAPGIGEDEDAVTGPGGKKTQRKGGEEVKAQKPSANK